jgi:hypothetical protein
MFEPVTQLCRDRVDDPVGNRARQRCAIGHRDERARLNDPGIPVRPADERFRPEAMSVAERDDWLVHEKELVRLERRTNRV